MQLIFTFSERNPGSSIGIVRISASYNKNESTRLFSSLFLLPYAANETYCRQWHALLNMNKTRKLQGMRMMRMPCILRLNFCLWLFKFRIRFCLLATISGLIYCFDFHYTFVFNSIR